MLNNAKLIELLKEYNIDNTLPSTIAERVFFFTDISGSMSTLKRRSDWVADTGRYGNDVQCAALTVLAPRHPAVKASSGIMRNLPR